jgi:hypothetical protein
MNQKYTNKKDKIAKGENSVWLSMIFILFVLLYFILIVFKNIY